MFFYNYLMVRLHIFCQVNIVSRQLEMFFLVQNCLLLFILVFFFIHEEYGMGVNVFLSYKFISKYLF